MLRISIINSLSWRSIVQIIQRHFTYFGICLIFRWPILFQENNEVIIWRYNLRELGKSSSNFVTAQFFPQLNPYTDKPTHKQMRISFSHSYPQHLAHCLTFSRLLINIFWIKGRTNKWTNERHTKEWASHPVQSLSLLTF